MRRLAVLAAALALSGCAGPRVRSGWAQIDRPGLERATNYQERFSHRPFDSDDATCAQLGLAPTGPAVVLVPGIGGDRAEWEEAVAEISASRPAALFMFRWGPMERLEAMTRDLALGLSTLLSCRPEEEVVVLAHSAGGIIASAAAPLVRAPPGDAPRLKILTVASPLAGILSWRKPGIDGGPQTHFIVQLGARLTPYSAPAPGVAAVHLRTHYPADPVMRPAKNFIPNDPAVGIPGARQLDLPADLGHDEALLAVASWFADGTWRRWFSPQLESTARRP